MNLTETKNEICVKDSKYTKESGFKTLTFAKIREKDRITTLNSLGLFCFQLKASDCCDGKCCDCVVFKTRAMFFEMADNIEELKKRCKK